MAFFNNERFFRNLSDYDDYLFYVAKKEGYEVPFLSAVGVREETIDRLIDSAVFVPEAKIASVRILKYFNPVVISTTYLRFVEKTAKRIGFSTVHASEVDFSLELNESTREELLKSVEIIASLRGDELYRFLDELMSKFWDRLAMLKVIGAKEKAEILELYEPENPIVIGDSITDCKMFKKAKELGGIAIAFNGNKYALEEADVAIVSNSAMSTAIVAETLLKGEMNLGLLKSRDYPRGTRVYIMSEADFDKVLERSMRMRVKLRGLAGSLG